MPFDARPRRPARGLLAAALALALAMPAAAQTLASRAREAGCIDAPQVLAGTNVYKCNTASGAPSMFNVPDGAGAPERPVRRSNSTSSSTATPPANASAPTPGLPRVDSATQKGRDDLRRRVLQDELSTEEKLLAESRTAYANGSPPPLPEERTQPQRYADRVSRLRDSVLRHERNVEMLRRELAIR